MSIEEPFSSGNSIIHRFDPRARIVLCFFLSLMVALCNHLLAILLALCLAISLVLCATLRLKSLLNRLMLINGFMLLLWIVIPFTIEGEPIFSLGPLRAGLQGVYLAAFITLKSNTILLLLISLMGTIPIVTLGKALGHLKIPVKIVYLVLFTYRYIHVIFEEYQRLINAIKMRGFQPHTNVHTYRTIAYLIGMLMVRSYERAQRIHSAMLCRGFNGVFYDLNNYSIGALDRFLLLCISLWGLCILVIQYKLWN